MPPARTASSGTLDTQLQRKCDRKTTGRSVKSRSGLAALLASFSAGAPDHLDVEIADLLAKRIPVHAEKLRGLDLIAAGRGKGRADQRILHLAENTMIEPWRGQAVAEAM